MNTTVSKSDMEELHSLLHLFLSDSMNKVKWTEMKWKSLIPCLVGFLFIKSGAKQTRLGYCPKLWVGGWKVKNLLVKM